MKRLFFLLLAALFVGSTVSCTENDPDKKPLEEIITTPEAVDIGLVIQREDGTSYKLKWANFNLGASGECESGYHYAWGETKRKREYLWTNYKFSSGEYDKLTGYCTKYMTHFWDSKKKPRGPDGLTQLLDADDVAHVKLGEKWRMPTRAELKALFALTTETYKDQYECDCNAEMTDSEGEVAHGLKITQKSTGNYVFLPAAGGFYNSAEPDNTSGYYWSSSLEESFPSAASCLKISIGEDLFTGVDSGDRYVGYSIRPVCEE